MEVQNGNSPGNLQRKDTGIVLRPRNYSLDEDEDLVLSEIQLYKKYIISSLALQRQVVINRVSIISKSVQIRELNRNIVSTFQRLSDDNVYSIRSSLAVQIGYIIEGLYQRDLEDLEESADFIESILNVSLSVLVKLLGDSVADVRDSSELSISKIIALVPEEKVKSMIIDPLLLNLNADDEYKLCTSIQVISSIIDFIDISILQDMFMPKFIAFCKHEHHSVRKACSSIFPVICYEFDAEYVLKNLYPLFQEFVDDDVWSVRKTTAFSMISMCKYFDSSMQKDGLVPLMQKLLNDSSRFVRNASYEALGQFLYNLDEEIISDEILSLYTDMPNLPSSIIDTDIAHYACAYNLSALVSKFGMKKWSNFESCFITLSRNPKAKVRKALSFSLHELAKNLDQNTCDGVIMKSFRVFLMDLDEIRVGVVKNIANLLLCVSEDERLKYIDDLRDITRESDRFWRMRSHLACQFDLFCKCFPLEILFSEILPLLLVLCRDRMAIIRLEAVKKVSAFVKLLVSHEEIYSELKDELYVFAKSQTFMERILYIKICDYLSRDLIEEEYCKDFLPLLGSLCTDPVVNVRISLSQTIISHLLLEKYFNNDFCKAVASVLYTDPAKDVNSIFKKITNEEIIDSINTSDYQTSLANFKKLKHKIIY